MTSLEVKVAGDGTVRLVLDSLVVAGFTGRDADAVKRHIDELARSGIARPAEIPELYVLPPNLLTTSNEIEVDGDKTSGEVEPVLFLTSDGTFVGVGSDHTDRERERESIAAAKHACPKIAGATVIPYEDIADRWDDLVVRSRVDGTRVYQEARLRELLPADAVVELVRERLGPQGNTAIFCGTVPLVDGGFTFSDRFAGELVDSDGSVLATCNYRVKRRAHADG